MACDTRAPLFPQLLLKGNAEASRLRGIQASMERKQISRSELVRLAELIVLQDNQSGEPIDVLLFKLIDDRAV
jgi:hypothetical protein